MSEPLDRDRVRAAVQRYTLPKLAELDAEYVSVRTSRLLLLVQVAEAWLANTPENPWPVTRVPERRAGAVTPDEQ